MATAVTTLFAQSQRDAAPTGQVDSETRPDSRRAFAEFVTKVRAAHRQAGAPRSVDAFRAKLDVRALASDKNLELSLDVRWKTPELLRYEIEQGETKKERGIDEAGEWEAVGAKVLDLQEQRSDAGLLEVQRHLQLCKQLVRLLDPAEVLAALRQPAPLKTETIAVSGVERAVPCIVVAGYLENFPLYHERISDSVQSVRCELYFAAADHRLRAMRITPLDQSARPHGDGEWIVLLDQKLSRGLLLPRALFVYAARSPGLEAVAKITIKQIDLEPNLAAADFKRPGR